MYSVIGFDSEASFKQEEFVVDYKGFELHIYKNKYEAEGKDYPPKATSNQIVIESDKEREAHIAGVVFLSEISWLFDVAIYDIQRSGGSIPIPINSLFAGHTGPKTLVDLSLYNPMELSEEQQIVIGLYKEAVSCNSVFYNFLGLFNILDIKMKGQTRADWLERKLEEKFGGDTSYLAADIYHLGRNYIAHGEINLDIHTFHDQNQFKYYSSLLRPIVRQYMVDKFKIPILIF